MAPGVPSGQSEGRSVRRSKPRPAVGSESIGTKRRRRIAKAFENLDAVSHAAKHVTIPGFDNYVRIHTSLNVLSRLGLSAFAVPSRSGPDAHELRIEPPCASPCPDRRCRK